MIIANMATFPAREAGLEAAVRRIAAQVDRVNLCLNEYRSAPSWVGDISNLDATIPDRDYKDLGKFIFDVGAEDDVFLVDDDLDYPHDYVSSTLHKRAALEGGADCVVGYHGTIYLRPTLLRSIVEIASGRGLRNTRTGRLRDVTMFDETLRKAKTVAQLGTGTVLVKGRHLAPFAYMDGAARRADARYARWCFENGIRQVVLSHTQGWLMQGAEAAGSIYHSYTKEVPAELVREIESFAFDVDLSSASRPRAAAPDRRQGAADRS